MSTYEAAITLNSSSPLPRHPITNERNLSPLKDDNITFSSSHGVESAYFKPSQSGQIRSTPSFTTARNVLGARSSAENVPIQRNPPKVKMTPNLSPVRRSTHCTAPRSSISPTKLDVTPSIKPQPVKKRQSAQWDAIQDGEPVVIKIAAKDVRKKKKDDDLGSLLAKAVAGRNDWTPPKAGAAASFKIDLAKAFGNTSEQLFTRVSEDAGLITKRRKIEVNSSSAVKPARSRMSSAVKPRSKSPVKKSSTITGLVTSHYDDKKEEESPMARYLISTQARELEKSMPGNTEIKMGTKKAKAKGKARSRLVSPGTAQKKFESQDLMFATASQLARDDSPTTLKNTVAAMKLSEEEHALYLTQHNSSIDDQTLSPAKSDLSRHVGRRRLWAEGARDEDGTLVQTDNLELSNLNDALADDVSAQPIDLPAGLPVSVDSMSLLRSLNRGAAAVLDEIADDGILDDSPDSPAKAVPVIQDTPKNHSQFRGPPKFIKPQSREYSTSQAASSKRAQQKSEIPLHPQLNDISQPKLSISPRFLNPNKPVPNQKPPPKPNYALWTDERLKEECKAVGIKRVRVRKSMIEKLDECWAQKYGLDPAKVKAAQRQAGKEIKKLQQVDLLGKALDFADRPAKPKPKIPKKKKEKGIVVSRNETEILDINDIDSPSFNAWDKVQSKDVAQDSGDDSLPEVDLPASTAPVKGTGVKARSKAVTRRALTPPPTEPDHAVQNSSPGFEIMDSNQAVAPEQSSTVVDIDGNIKSRILPALLTQSTNMHARNQQTNPTWHQKVLMYDPIVLEDFTAWLNIEGFNNINEDGEIDAQTVKVWCHENGICCLWKGGWRGNKKKAKNEDSW